ncbi:MAG: EamA family transporter [Oscillospiraceae bacterium]
MSNEVLFTIIFLISVLVAAVSQILLKKSANKTYASPLKEYLNPMVIIAYGLFFLSSLITVLAYRYVPLSAGPILESTGYIYVAVLSFIFLKEKISKRKLLGMGLIIFGILVFSLGGIWFP